MMIQYAHNSFISTGLYRFKVGCCKLIG